MEDSHPLGSREIAALFGKSLETVRKWRYSGKLPEPTWPGTVNGQPAWSFEDISKWGKRTGRPLKGELTAPDRGLYRRGPKTLAEVFREEGLLE